MAGVARILELFGTRLDSLQMQIAQMDRIAQTANANQAGQRGFDARPEPAGNEKVGELQSDITQLRTQLREVKDGQAATFKKERSVTEAVLTQKIERMIGDKSAPSIRKADDAQDTVAKLSDRVNAITVAVDKQAKFLTELNAKLTQSIDAAVDRRVSDALAKHKTMSGAAPDVQVNAVPSDDAPNNGTDADSLDNLEESPDLGQSDVGDQIDMVAAGSAGAAKKGRGKGRAKAKEEAKNAP